MGWHKDSLQETDRIYRIFGTTAVEATGEHNSLIEKFVRENSIKPIDP